MRSALSMLLALCALLSGAASAQTAAAPAAAAPAAAAPSTVAQPVVAPAPAAPDHVLIVGGTRRTGLEIVKLLLARGQAVTVMARPSSDTSAIEQLGVPIVRADALDTARVKAAFAGGRFRAVISTLGASRSDKKPPDFEGNRNVIDAAKDAGVRRFLLVSTIGAGSSSDTASVAAKLMYGNVMTLKTQAEEYLAASGLDYTVIRPGGLLDKEASGKAVLSEDPATFSLIARADLAQLLVDALDDRKTIGRTYSAYDETREGFWARWRE